MRRLIVSAVLVLVATVAHGQTPTPVPSPTPTSVRIGWDHDGVNTDGYAILVDTVRTTVVPTCAVVATVRTCEMPFPAMTPGRHTIVIIAFNAAGEGASAPLQVELFVKPADPAGVRIIRSGS